MLRLAFPGALLAFTMMPVWWLAIVAGTVMAGLIFATRPPHSRGRRTRTRLLACAHTVLAVSLYLAAAYRAAESCQQQPPDGLCVFAGLPLLSLSLLYLAVAFASWFSWAVSKDERQPSEPASRSPCSESLRPKLTPTDGRTSAPTPWRDRHAAPPPLGAARPPIA